jgi:hypothetical protein
MKRSFFSAWNLVRHKWVEIQLQLFGNLTSWFELNIRYNDKCDHAGLYCSLSLLKLFFLEINLYDNRHWNVGEGRYYLDNEEINAYNDGVRGCTNSRLSNEFDWATAQELRDDVGHIQTLAHPTFARYAGKNKVADQYMKEVGDGLRDFEEWLDEILGNKN